MRCTHEKPLAEEPGAFVFLLYQFKLGRHCNFWGIATTIARVRARTTPARWHNRTQKTRRRLNVVCRQCEQCWRRVVNVITGDKHLRYRESMLWVQQHLDGLILAEPCKRTYLSGACLHASIEHGMAILVLVDEGLYGSALALIRLQFEAYIRGLWLAQCASEGEVDKASRDKFPAIDGMIASLEKPGLLDSAFLSKIKSGAWKRLNSLTHTGNQQIGPRLSKDGIGSYFDDDQIRVALNWAETLAILSAVAFAGLAKDDQLALDALERARVVAAP